MGNQDGFHFEGLEPFGLARKLYKLRKINLIVL